MSFHALQNISEGFGRPTTKSVSLKLASRPEPPKVSLAFGHPRRVVLGPPLEEHRSEVSGPPTDALNVIREGPGGRQPTLELGGEEASS